MFPVEVTLPGVDESIINVVLFGKLNKYIKQARWHLSKIKGIDFRRLSPIFIKQKCDKILIFIATISASAIPTSIGSIRKL